MTASRSAHKPLMVERLEERHLMAGDVMAHVNGQMLVIWGDTADNGVVLTYNSSAQSYRVSGATAGGSATTINGLDTSLPANVQDFTGVKQVYVGLNGGNDSFEVGSPTAVDAAFQQWLSIDMGDGDDSVVLGVSGNSAAGGAPVARSLDVGTSLTVNLGVGNDHLSLANAKVGLALNLLAGDGNDEVSFDTQFTPSGATTPSQFPIRVAGNAQITLGGGDDELTMRDASVQGSLTILDGAGVANIQLNNVGVKNNFNINTADGADEINLRNIRAKQLSINSNGGVDHVVIGFGVFTSMNIKLGAARDRLRLDSVKTSLAANLDGGSQIAVISGTGNSLHGLLRRNFG